MGMKKQGSHCDEDGKEMKETIGNRLKRRIIAILCLISARLIFGWGTCILYQCASKPAYYILLDSRAFWILLDPFGMCAVRQF